MKPLISCILLALVAVHQPAIASDDLCLESAPLFDSDHYYDIAVEQAIPDKQLKLLRNFAKKVAGQWRGGETVAFCEGHWSKPVAVTYQYEMDADITRSSRGVVRLEAEKELIDRSGSKLQTLWLTPETEALSNRQHWHTLEFIDRNTLIYSHKYRARNGGAGNRAPNARDRSTARLLHEVNKLAFRGNVLRIDRKIYVNGAMVEQSGIELKRRG